MNTNPNMGQFNLNMGDKQNVSNPVKKMPNPSNYKIVKCKNYEMGKYLSI